MTPQIEHLKELFELALSQPSDERYAFVRDACSGDRELETELSSLLEAHSASSGFFERLAEELVAPALAASGLDDSDEVVGFDRIVSHYELMERIARGGMGVVYKARDTRLGRTVALKFLPGRHALNPDARARLLAEARAASALDHPNIGVVYEIGEAENGRQFIAMAWYDGETLRDKVKRGPLSISESVAIAAQLGNALAAAHKAGIIHRDVKPANIIITAAGSVKLLDFGIAKLMSAEDGDSHRAAGTIAYMSPEQTRSVPIDARTDLWSLGVVLYEILVGQRPFKRNSDEETVLAIRNDEASSLLSLRPDVAPAMAKLIGRCLAKNPAERYQTAEEFCSALASLDRNWNLPSESIPQRKRVKSATSLLAVAVVVAGTWGYSRYSSHLSDRAPGNARPLSIAVLPFVDSTERDSSKYVAVAVGEELRTELSRIPSLTVPAYMSSRNYVGSVKPDSQIAREMGANFLLRGTVRGGAAGTQVNIRLVDGQTGKKMWERAYSASGSAEVHLVASASREILALLHLDLTTRETEELARSPTNNVRAYDLYLQARSEEVSGISRNIWLPPASENMRIAQAMYAKARALDPDFARARARLAISHMYSATTYDTTRARMDQARLEAEVALRLDSSLSEAHDALSQYWTRDGDQRKTIDEIEVALRRTPNDANLVFALGSRLVAAGRWEEGAVQLDRAMRLDPRNALVAWYAAVTNGRMRHNERAMPAFDRLIEMNPDDYLARIIKGHSFLRWKGSVDTLAAELRALPPTWDANGSATYGWYTVFRIQRRYRDGLAMLDHARSGPTSDGNMYIPVSLMRADMYKGLGDERAARAQFEIARAFLVDSMRAHPNDPSIHSTLGLVYAGLGRKREAIAEADRAMAILPLSVHSMDATAFMGTAIETFAQVGEKTRALQIIELLLSMPAGREVTVPFLKVWPGFDPLRGDPRFAQLIERFTMR